jgi:thioredoxin-like negative regulator of GroEL
MNEVLYFSAVWCAPCRVVSNNVERLKAQYPDVKFRKIDVDESAEAASAFQIRSVPTLVHLQDGKEVARVVGARTVDDLAKGLGL